VCVLCNLITNKKIKIPIRVFFIVFFLNGTERNGTERNGTERNGTERNGTERNGTERNGTENTMKSKKIEMFFDVYM